MTAIFTADLHLSDNPRDVYRADWFVEELPRLLKKHKCEELIIGGDLTEEKDRHGSALTNLIAHHMHTLAQSVRVIIYKGNHDYVSDDMPFFRFLNCIENVAFFDEVIEIGTSVGSCLILPHTRDYINDWKNVDAKNIDWVLAHNTFKGAIFGNDRRSESGPPADYFGKGVNVLSGDVHIPQFLGPVTYVGAPYTIDFGDDYEPRVLLLDHAGGAHSINTKGPQKRLVEVANVKELNKIDYLNPRDIVKVRVTVDQFANDTWSSVKDKVAEWAERNKLIVHATIPVVKEAQGKRVMRAASPHRDDKATLNDFAKVRGVDDKTLKTGHYLMERAK